MAWGVIPDGAAGGCLRHLYNGSWERKGVHTSIGGGDQNEVDVGAGIGLASLIHNVDVLPEAGVQTIICRIKCQTQPPATRHSHWYDAWGDDLDVRRRVDNPSGSATGRCAGVINDKQPRSCASYVKTVMLSIHCDTLQRVLKVVGVVAAVLEAQGTQSSARFVEIHQRQDVSASIRGLLDGGSDDGGGFYHLQQQEDGRSKRLFPCRRYLTLIPLPLCP